MAQAGRNGHVSVLKTMSPPLHLQHLRPRLIHRHPQREGPSVFEALHFQHHFFFVVDNDVFFGQVVYAVLVEAVLEVKELLGLRPRGIAMTASSDAERTYAGYGSRL